MSVAIYNKLTNRTKTQTPSEIKINKIPAKIKNNEQLESTFESEIDELLNDEKKDEETKIRIIKKNDTFEDNPKSQSSEKKHTKKKESKDLSEDFKIEDTETDEKVLPNQWEEKIEYNFPTIELLNRPLEEDYQVAEEELTKNAQLLKDKLKLFDIDIKDISVTPGPVVTLYEIVPAPGVKISRIVGLENDIALALAARGIRIIAPIPGKSAIGVEIPNMKASLVTARSVLTHISESNFELPLALGKTISGDVYIADLSKMPHLLIAGSTGSGKSVGINMIISSLLYSKHPSEIKFCLVDPKKIELSFYQKIKKHFLAISPDLDESIITTPQNAVIMLKAVELEMNKRYDKLSNAGVRNIVDYNKKVSNPKTRPHDTETIKHHPIPYIVVVVDELADLMLTSGREVEEPITRLAQMARAVGIHLILATQRPSVNVITGVIKANFSSRIAYQVATKIDSRTVLDMNGAEQLLGSGDMLFLPTGSPKPIRIQNAFISTDEVEKITNYIYSQPAFSKSYYLPSLYEAKQNSGGRLNSDLDPMFEDAAKLIVKYQQGSVSLLQRKLKLGYSRAARIVDQLEDAGIVGPNDGSKARLVLVDNEETLETILRNL
jgi:S-DNA-T family DNA segregation ATPase FtsK/SpoIIIE